MLNRSSGGQEDGQTDGQVFSGSSGDRHVDFSYPGLVRRSPLSCSPKKKRQDFQINAPVAQSDRAIDFESKGRGFDSLQARHILRQSRNIWKTKNRICYSLVTLRRKIIVSPRHPAEIRLSSGPGEDWIIRRASLCPALPVDSGRPGPGPPRIPHLLSLLIKSFGSVTSEKSQWNFIGSLFNRG